MSNWMKKAYEEQLKRHYIVVQQGDRGPFFMSVMEMPPKPGDKIYWGGEMSHMMWHDTFTILKEYGQGDCGDLEKTFIKEYPPKKSPPSLTNGWLSPEGDFYACRYGGHESLASDLCVIVSNKYGNGDDLIKRNWIKLLWDGYFDHEIINQTQRNILGDIALSGDTSEHKALKRYLSMEEEDMNFTLND